MSVLWCHNHSAEARGDYMSKVAPQAIDESGYTFELHSTHLTQQRARAEFYGLKRTGAVLEDSKYRVKRISDELYALYIWY